MKKANRILSALLCLVLLLGVLPVSALADGAEKPLLDVSRSKTATALTSDWTSEVTLSLPSAEEKLKSDVVFVLDKSTSTTLEGQALQLLTDLKNLVEPNNINVKVGVVIFNKIATVTAPLTDLSTGYDTIKTAIETTITSGTNTHAGLLAGKKLLDDDDSVPANRKYMIFVSDGVTYQFCQDDDYNKAYTRSFDRKLDPDNTNREGTLSELLNVQYPDKAKNSIPMDNINTWMTDISSRIGTENDNSDWDYEYTGHAPEDSSKLLQSKKMSPTLKKHCT